MATRVTSKRSSRTSAAPPTAAEEGIVIADLYLKPIAFDHGAAVILSGASPLSEDAEKSLCLPPEVVEAITGRNAADVSVIRTRFHKNGTTYSCYAYLVRTLTADLAQPVMVLRVLKDLPEVEAIGLAAAEYGLTDREQEVFRGILRGDTTKELAARLRISPNTIKAFLRLIIIKMGVTTRTGIVSELPNEMEHWQWDGVGVPADVGVIETIDRRAPSRTRSVSCV